MNNILKNIIVRLYIVFEIAITAAAIYYLTRNAANSFRWYDKTYKNVVITICSLLGLSILINLVSLCLKFSSTAEFRNDLFIGRVRPLITCLFTSTCTIYLVVVRYDSLFNRTFIMLTALSLMNLHVIFKEGMVIRLLKKLFPGFRQKRNGRAWDDFIAKSIL